MKENMDVKILPHSIEAEQAVIGSILVDENAIYKVIELGLTPEDFYRPEHQEIMRVAMELVPDGIPVDIIVINDELKATGKIDFVGGTTYLMRLASSVPNSANIEYYAKIVKHKAKLRELIKVGYEIAELGFDEVSEFDDILNEAFQKLLNIAQISNKEGFVQLKDIIKSEMMELQEKYEKRGNRLSGIATGFPSLDKITAGFQNSDLIVIAARPGVGKTAIALNMIKNISVENGIPSALFSLEMSKEQINQRLMSIISGIDLTKLKTGFLREEDWKRVIDAFSLISDTPVFVDDSPKNTLMDIQLKSKTLKAEKNVGIIFIDYLQLIHTGKKFDNRVLEISEITAGLKNLAKELNIPIVVMSQLNRSIERRENKVPVLSDLRESGSIEQDADIVMFLHNPDENDKEQTNLIIAKHRNGPTGEVRLVFHKEYSKFVELQDNK
jgi:replicative DNA helicase